MQYSHPFLVGNVLLGGCGRLGETMTMNVAWQELYQAALLELRPEALRQRIDDAERAIRQRIAELRQNESSSEDERQALDDALRGLRVLASTECKSPRSAFSRSAQSEAAS